MQAKRVNIEPPEQVVSQDLGHAACQPDSSLTCNIGLENYCFSLTPLGSSAVNVGRLGCLRGVRRAAGNASKPYEPLAFCGIVAEHPARSLLATGLFWFSFCLLTGVLVLSGVDVFPAVFDQVPLNIIDDPSYIRYEAWVNAPESVTYKRSTTPEKRTKKATGVYLLYKTSNNILTKEILSKMQSEEATLPAVDGYNSYCMLLYGKCIPQLSIVGLFDGTLARLYSNSDAFFNATHDPSFEKIGEVVKQWWETLPDVVETLVGKDFDVKIPRVSVVRTVFWFGYPIEGYDDPDVETNDQLKVINTWITDNMADRITSISVPGCRVLYMNEGLAGKAVKDQVVMDLLLAVGSLFFVWSFMWFQTRSLTITAVGIGGILMAFVVTNLFYRFVLGYKFFGIFHVLSVFIILGIGADDIFVFYDSWVQSRCASEEIRESPSKRLSLAYRKSIAAILVTSLTTMFSFLSSANTPLLAMHTFGLYSALLILFNFIVVCTLLPCAMVVWEKYFIHRKILCLRYTSESVTYGSSYDTGTELGPVDRFFKNTWSAIVTHRIGKFVICLIFTVVISVFAAGAARLEVDKEDVKIWKPGTNWQDFKTINAQDMTASAESSRVQILIAWGLHPQDMSVCDGPSDFKCKGEVRWDDSFDLNPKPAQIELQDICDTIRNLSRNPNLAEKLAVKIDRNGEVELNCFMSFVKREYEEHEFPISKDSITAASPQLVTTSPYNDSLTYYRWFELAVASLAGLEPRLAPVDIETRTIFTTKFAGLMGAVDESKYGAKMKYSAITINTDLLYPVTFVTGLPVDRNWESFLSDIRKDIAPSISGFWHIGRKTSNGLPSRQGDNSFHWMKVQEKLVSTAISGIVLGLVLALIVLIFASANLMVGFIAAFVIACIVVMVLGMIYYVGWKIGVLESLNLTLVVGLSVDYVVHLAHAYVESESVSRDDKVRDCLTTVGVSIISGAATSLGSSLFMLFAEIVFFFQFGIFMFATIGFSVTFSLGFFPALMSIIGPQGEKGALTTSFSFKKIRNGFIYLNRSKGRDGIIEECQLCDGYGHHFKPVEVETLPSMALRRRDLLVAAFSSNVITHEEFVHAEQRLRQRAHRASIQRPHNPLVGVQGKGFLTSADNFD